jgi:hypothetical protein
MFKFTVQFAINDRADFDLWLERAAVLITRGEMFDGFTWAPVNGVWKGEPETSYKLEILSEDDILGAVECLARYIKSAYRQEAVLITREEVFLKFV